MRGFRTPKSAFRIPHSAFPYFPSWLLLFTQAEQSLLVVLEKQRVSWPLRAPVPGAEQQCSGRRPCRPFPWVVDGPADTGSAATGTGPHTPSNVARSNGPTATGLRWPLVARSQRTMRTEGPGGWKQTTPPGPSLRSAKDEIGVRLSHHLLIMRIALSLSLSLTLALVTRMLPDQPLRSQHGDVEAARERICRC